MITHLSIQPVIKRYSNADDFTLMYELLQLEDELGFSNTNADVPELDEVAQRLFTVRNEWLWKEACDGSSLQEVPPIHELDESGIYNRAVLVAAERKLYTRKAWNMSLVSWPSWKHQTISIPHLESW